jgi:hypothetical protein
MTLNVSLRVPDGIVLASDSLATLIANINQKMNVSAKCPTCTSVFQITDVQTPPMKIPSSTWPYAQKMYPLKGRFGMATFGSGFVNNRSIYNHVVELASKFPVAVEGECHLDKMAEFIVEYFKAELMKEWVKHGVNAELQPDDYRPFGFHLVGFKNDAGGDPVPTTYVLNIGKAPSIEKYDQIGCAVTGDQAVVKRLWPSDGRGGANFQAFSLQDAIDYAKFLIRTTADFQRFSGNLPTVGGDIDVALITNHRGFRWIHQKELYRVLDKEDNI